MPRQMVPARRRAKMVGVGPTKFHRFGLGQFGVRPSPGMGLEISLHGSNHWPPMSALGQKQTSAHVRVMSALPPKADIGTQSRNVRFVPKADSCTAANSTADNGLIAEITACRLNAHH